MNFSASVLEQLQHKAFLLHELCLLASVPVHALDQVSSHALDPVELGLVCQRVWPDSELEK